MKTNYYLIKVHFRCEKTNNQIICNWCVKGKMLTMGKMLKMAEEYADFLGETFRKDSFCIDNIIRLTKEEYDAIADFGEGNAQDEEGKNNYLESKMNYETS